MSSSLDQVAASPAANHAAARRAHAILRSSRLILLVGAIAYSAWFFILNQLVPDAHDSLPERLCLSAAALGLLALSWRPEVERHVEAGTRVMAMVITAHALWLVQRNDGSAHYQIGLVVVLAAVGAGLVRAQDLKPYSLLVVIGAAAVALSIEDTVAGRTLVACAVTVQSVVVAATWRRTALERALADELADSRDFVLALLDRLPDPVFVRGAEGRYELINDAFCTLIGLPRERVIGRTPREAFEPFGTAALPIIEQHARELGEQPVEYEMQFTNAQGGTRVTLTKLSRLPLRDGRVLHAGVIRDISARKAMERTLAETEALFRNAFEHAPIGMALVSNKARILRVNVALCEMLGYTEHELDGVSLSALTHPDDLEFCTGQTMRLISGEVDVTSYEKRYLRKSGEVVWVLANASAVQLHPGKRDLYVAQVVDITARRQAAEVLLLAKDQAEAATRAKSVFLATMSHEIRTPMNGVLAALDLSLHGRLDIDQREYLQLARTSALSLLRIIDDVLDLSKIEAGRLELILAPLHLRFECTAVVRAAGVLARQKGLTLNTKIEDDVPDLLIGDAVRLRQILTNLVGNAVKFTDHGEVSVYVRALESPPGDRLARLAFEVVDTGPGISAEHLTDLFEPFVQGDDRDSRRHGGTGLGLAIARQLVTGMSGHIHVDSVAGHGSTFRFEIALPVASAEDFPEPDETVTPPPAEQGAMACRVLLVDDNAINLVLMRRLLERAGYEVTIADSGVQALALLACGPFDVVLMDVQMPGMDGLVATRMIHDQPALADMPVIGLTAQAMAGDRERCLAAGMAGYVTKPVDFDTLDADIRRVVAGRPPRAVQRSLPDDDLAQRLLQRLGGDVDLIGQLCELFMTERPRLDHALDDAIAAGNAKQLADAAHRYKGVLLNLGAEEAGTCADELEQLARAGTTTALGPHVHELQARVVAFLPRLQNVAAELSR